MTHDQLVQQAKAAIERVFSDTSVSQETTIDSLESLVETLEMDIEAIKCDLGGLGRIRGCDPRNSDSTSEPPFGVRCRRLHTRFGTGK